MKIILPYLICVEKRKKKTININLTAISPITKLSTI